MSSTVARGFGERGALKSVPGSFGSWRHYNDWNDALAATVYGPEAVGVPVYLDLEDRVLRTAAALVGDGVEDPRESLVAAVRATLSPPDHAGGIFAGHISRLRQWRPGSADPPPVIALLAVLCLAAEDMREGDGFAANNYYDRLMPLLGITSKDNKNRVVASYRKVSSHLWESLNGWLEGLHGERGLPTAYAYAHPHIGRPLSQALIRAADRAKLEDFFSELGFEQGSRLSPEDMEPLLAAWISRVPSPASNQIRALWKRAGARERITDIACQLLETWEPSPDLSRRKHLSAHDKSGRPPLRLLASFRSFPSPALEFNLIGPAAKAAGIARVVDPNDGRDLEIEIELETLPDGRWRPASVGVFDSRSLIEGAIRLRLSAAVTVERRPRRVIPFRKDEMLQAFVEVERLGLGEDGLLLCASSIAGIVEDALSKIARPGFQRVHPCPPGCPAGWVPFTNVQVLAPLFSATPTSIRTWPLDLNVLQPIATSLLVVQGGLRLPGRVRRWSSLAPPEIRASGDEVDLMSIHLDRVGMFQERHRVFELDSQNPFVAADLQGANLPDGDYEVTAVGSVVGSRSRNLGTTRLRLRSGDMPNPAQGDQPRLVRPLDGQAVGALFASVWDGMTPAVRGPTLIGTPEPRWPPLRQAWPPIPPWWESRRVRARSMEEAGDSTQVALSAAAPSDCFESGAHYLELPTFYGTSTAIVEGVCKYCGLAKRFPGSYYRMRRRRSSKEPRLADLPVFDVTGVTPVRPGQLVTPDIALDALTHDGQGPAAWLEQLALQVGPSALFVDRFIRSLDVLGHLEVQRDAQSLDLVRWEVLPPAFVELATGGYALSGSRSRRIMDAVARAAAGVGARVERTAQGDAAPDRIHIPVGPDDVTTIASAAGEMAGLEFVVVHDAARALVSNLPPLAWVINALPRQAMISARSIRRWNPTTAYWESTGDASSPGAYHLMGPASRYCLRDQADVEAGTMRRVDPHVAKHVAALTAHESLIGYDDATQSLYLPLGADLPGLWGRAVVLCTGLVPVEDQRQGLLRYHKVPRDVANRVAALLQHRGAYEQ